MATTIQVNSPDPLSLCRQDIDRIDGVLVALLRERTRLAMQAGEIKLASGEPVHAAAREAAVLQRVQELAVAPLAPDAIARIFACIIDETRTAELKIGD
jgi:chorismate mutase / prephenate dehydratase